MILYDLVHKRQVERMPGPSVCAIGNFDGVHRGHVALLRETVRVAQDSLCPAVFTFEANTSLAPPILTFKQKSDLLAEHGISYVIVCPFEEVRTLSCEDFVGQWLIKTLDVRHAVCGFNFRFGYKGAGNAETLSLLMDQNGGSCHVLPPEMQGDAPVSSTRIRAALEAGDMPLVNAMLGRMYDITAPILHGKHLGSTLGFPTANQALPAVLHPRNGVYASVCRVKNACYASITNIGTRPTVEHTQIVNAETHILDASLDLYGKTVCVYPLFFIRDEQPFADEQALQKAVANDKETARHLLQNASLPFVL